VLPHLHEENRFTLGEYLCTAYVSGSFDHLQCGFESRSEHECMHVYCCYVEFSCTGEGTTVGRSPVPGEKRFQKIRYVLIVNRKRTKGLWTVRRLERK
jgi:hypothetical protein